MCGQFGLFARLNAIQDYFDAEFTYDYEPRYNIAPEGEGTAAVQDESPDEISQLNWASDHTGSTIRTTGITPSTPVPKPSPRSRVIGRRSSSVDVSSRRTTSTSGPGPKGKRRQFFIGVENRELFAMAGLWETWSDNGTEFRSFTIITTDANEVVGELHDRMPVILERDEQRQWLEDDDPDELHPILDPYLDERTELFEVTTKVNNTANEGQELIEPVGSDQSGLSEFS